MRGSGVLPFNFREEIATVQKSFESGGGQIPKLSSSFGPWIAAAWAIASAEFCEDAIRSVHLFYALARNPAIIPRLASKEHFGLVLDHFPGFTVREYLESVASSGEERVAVPLGSIPLLSGKMSKRINWLTFLRILRLRRKPEERIKWAFSRTV
jgi:hypothetical protein